MNSNKEIRLTNSCLNFRLDLHHLNAAADEWFAAKSDARVIPFVKRDDKDEVHTGLRRDITGLPSSGM